MVRFGVPRKGSSAFPQHASARERDLLVFVFKKLCSQLMQDLHYRRGFRTRLYSYLYYA
jgi:hypothetical protein